MSENKSEFKNSETKTERRSFLKTTLISGISFLCLPMCVATKGVKPIEVKYKISLNNPTRFYDGKSCFVHSRAGIVSRDGEDLPPRVVMTMSTQDLSGSDVYKSTYGMETDDLGQSWTSPSVVDRLAPRYEIVNREKHPVALGDFWPKWHKNSKTLLGTGHTVFYTPEWKVTRPRPRHPAYAIYNEEKRLWSKWKKLVMPDYKRFHDCGAGSTQRYDEKEGTILLPLAFHPDPLGQNGSVTIARCSFINKKLEYMEHGDEISIDDETRGLYEPSITCYKEKYFLTIRHNFHGYVTSSGDGLHFDPIKIWKFDDGSELGNYNTQQHWVTHSDGLFLIYTRKGANNDHVFRHRAPLFIGQVDPENLCIIRETEQILVPERGARLGNFGVTEVSPKETWITVSEWMQPKGVEKYGSDGSLWVAKIKWNKPNKLFSV
ncbi:hypothetical protein [Membranihabitans marinus]|uniref:hypothetical protein n=1 Tax=Membranihabitans marinus TaxID=1227546 RepID=UPI001F3063C7|nr:hypothetical protein [Membranihabitans marinus]